MRTERILWAGAGVLLAMLGGMIVAAAQHKTAMALALAVVALASASALALGTFAWGSRIIHSRATLLAYRPLHRPWLPTLIAMAVCAGALAALWAAPEPCPMRGGGINETGLCGLRSGFEGDVG